MRRSWPKVPLSISTTAGEPLLHPDLRDFLLFLKETGLRAAISTNASRAVLFDEAAPLESLDYIGFSMPGFSTSSYDRIHGFDFSAVRENITRMVENYRRHGFTGVAEIIFHVYQFNLDEIESAAAFASGLGMKFLAHAAFLNGYDMFKSYLTGEMPYEELKRAAGELLLFDIDRKTRSAPADYACPQYDFLILDEDCSILTCCVLERDHEDYSVGSLFDLSADEIERRKRNRPVCRECLRLGISYLSHNPLVVEESRLRLK